MKLPLLREAQTRSRVEGTKRRARDACHRCKPRAMDRLQLFFQYLHIITRRNEQVPAEAFKFTVDAFVPDDGFYRVDRFGMTVGGQSCTLSPVQSLDFRISIVERIHQMRGRAACFAASDLTIVKNDYRLSRYSKKVRGGQTGNARTHNTDVGRGVCVQRMLARNLNRLQPDRR